MKNTFRAILSISLVLLIGLLVYNTTKDLSVSYSLVPETEQKETLSEEQKQEEQKSEEEKHESNKKVLFYSGMILGIVLIGAMLFVFMSKDEN